MGREWNDTLARRLQDSIVKASDGPKAVRLLVTDLENSDLTLVEVIGQYEDSGRAYVIGEFLVKPTRRPKVLRYRAERGWPE
jgi:hypothetical protein